jgi:hypothetical protein
MLYPVKRVFRVNCREAARGGFLQEKKPPCINKIPNTLEKGFTGRQFLFPGPNRKSPRRKAKA